MNAALDATSVGKADVVIFFVKPTIPKWLFPMPWCLKKKIRSSYPSERPGQRRDDLSEDRSKEGDAGRHRSWGDALGPGHIRHAGWGKTFIGELDHRITDRAGRIARRFVRQDRDRGLLKYPRPCVGETSGQCRNQCLDALTGFKNGQLLDYPRNIQIDEETGV